MKLQPPRAPVPDPFFAAFRRRHPDVDVVLLRPDPAPEVAEPAGDEVVAALVEEAGRALREVRGLVAGSVAGLDAVPRLGHAGRPGAVAARVRASGPTAEGTAALDALTTGLPGHGWQVSRTGGAPPVLVARRGPLRIRATYAAATGTVLVEVTSEPVPVGAARARALVTP